MINLEKIEASTIEDVFKSEKRTWESAKQTVRKQIKLELARVRKFWGLMTGATRISSHNITPSQAPNKVYYQFDN